MTDDPTLECAVHVARESPQPGMTVVRPQGPLDMHSVPAFHQILEAAVQRAERGLIVALADITCMDSSGLAVLIEGLKWSRGRALPYVLTHVTPAVQRVLELARLEHLFPIAPSVEEAARLCQRPGHTAPPGSAAAGVDGTEGATRATGGETPPRHARQPDCAIVCVPVQAIRGEAGHGRADERTAEGAHPSTSQFDTIGALPRWEAYGPTPPLGTDLCREKTTGYCWRTTIHGISIA